MRLANAMRKWLELLPDIRERAIHIEYKIDAANTRLETLASRLPGVGTGTPLVSADGEQFFGHADQRYGHLTYSQHGEDLVLVSLFEQLGIEHPTYLDIGAHHPLNCSNTALIHRRGGRGVNVDANPNLLAEFNRMRPDDINLNLGVAGQAGELTFYCIDATSGRNTFSREAARRFVEQHPEFSITAEISVPVTTLDELVARHCGGNYPDLLSLDAEGLDQEILVSASFTDSKPKLICVEVDSAAGERKSTIIEVLQCKGFVPYITMGANVVFVEQGAAMKLRFHSINEE